jgi:hypothetical protein
MLNSTQAKGFAIGLLVIAALLSIAFYVGVNTSQIVIVSIILTLIITIAAYMIVISNEFQSILNKIHDDRGSYEP